MNDLKPCPFCGSKKLKIQSTQRRIGVIGTDEPVAQETFSVRCNVCYARGSAVGGKVILTRLRVRESELPDWASSRESLKEKAIEAWNRRINDG
jgi:Lar family restriction alleviation protein